MSQVNATSPLRFYNQARTTTGHVNPMTKAKRRGTGRVDDPGLKKGSKDKTYVVEDILDRRTKGDKEEFLVKWKGELVNS